MDIEETPKPQPSQKMMSIFVFEHDSERHKYLVVSQPQLPQKVSLYRNGVDPQPPHPNCEFIWRCNRLLNH